MHHATRSRSTATIAKLAELSIAAPQVVALRTAQMLAAGATPSARDSAEFSRMGAEKTAAFTESMLGMGRQMLKTNQEYTRSVFTRLVRMWMTPWWLSAYRPATQKIASLPSPASLFIPTRRQQHAAVAQLVAKAVAPVHKRATANAKRLITKAATPARKRAAASGKRIVAKVAAPARKRTSASVKRRGAANKRSRS
jgi:hypothetical protein